MKKIKRILTITLVLSGILIISISCRNAGSYADDAYRAVKGKVDDVINGNKKIRPPRNIKQKICSSCNGSGNVYIHGYWYECSNCGGDGKVWIN